MILVITYLIVLSYSQLRDFSLDYILYCFCIRKKDLILIIIRTNVQKCLYFREPLRTSLTADLKAYIIDLNAYINLSLRN